VNDLKRLAALQARVYEFLAQQDEATLEALLDGTRQLAIAGTAEPPPRTPEDLSALTVKEMQALAKNRRLRGYSKLTRAQLVDLLSGSPERAETRTVPEEPPQAPPARRPDFDVAAVAAHLRETESEEEGAAYLQEQRLDREGLLAVAAELQLTRVSRLNQRELEKRVLKQAIGARRKFAGLRKW
jgi:hypothetical protein